MTAVSLHDPARDAPDTPGPTLRHEAELEGFIAHAGSPHPEAWRFAVAVLIPCRNEGLSVRAVVHEFRRALPQALIFVYDNNSTDNTAAEARAAGAIVREERAAGKGNVVRRMFADVEADVYVLADGDGTYQASMAPVMVQRMISERLDMVVGTRRGIYANAHRAGHGLGNRLFNKAYAMMFGNSFTDIFSGYRVFSRRFVKSFPAGAAGFEIETEMSVHAGQLRMPVAEIPTTYTERAAGSCSKLRTFHDAGRILRTFMQLFKETRPVSFFGLVASAFLVAGLTIGWPVVKTYLDTGMVPRLPSALLASSLVLLAAITGLCGLVLDSVARGRLETKRMNYLATTQFAGLPGNTRARQR